MRITTKLHCEYDGIFYLWTFSNGRVELYTYVDIKNFHLLPFKLYIPLVIYVDFVIEEILRIILL